jgi:hypothetical protein
MTGHFTSYETRTNHELATRPAHAFDTHKPPQYGPAPSQNGRSEPRRCRAFRYVLINVSRKRYGPP